MLDLCSGPGCNTCMSHTLNCAGLSLAIIHLLKLAVPGSAHFGIKCSSFCGMNKGTSRRSACSSVGYVERASVAYSNKLLERTDRQWFSHLQPRYSNP